MEGHLRLSATAARRQGRHRGRRADPVGARPERAERHLHRRPQAREGLAMNLTSSTSRRPRRAQARRAHERLRAREPRAHEPAQRLLEPADRGAVRGDRVPRRGPRSPAAARSWSTPASTRRAPRSDKFIVREASTEDHVWWGEYNRPFAPDKFDELSQPPARASSRGATCSCRTATRRATRTTGCRSASSPSTRGTACSRGTCSSCRRAREEYREHVPEFTIVCAPSFKASRPIDGTAYEHVHRAELRPAGCASSATPATPARSRSRSSRC